MKSPLLILAGLTATLLISACGKGDPQPRIVKAELVTDASSDSYFPPYQVKGSIQNPTKHAMKDVVICYRVWGKLKGAKATPNDGIAASSRKTGDAAYAHIKTLAPGETVAFTAVGHPPVPNYEKMKPDPIKAEVTAKWVD